MSDVTIRVSDRDLGKIEEIQHKLAIHGTERLPRKIRLILISGKPLSRKNVIRAALQLLEEKIK